MRSNQAMIRDQSHPDWIAIKYKCGGDHEELKILLKSCLIPSRFNEELSFRREITPFYRGKSREKYGPFDPVKVD